MVDIFYSANQRIREHRPIFTEHTCCEFFEENDLLEIAIPAHRCVHDMYGGCIMCNFGANSNNYSNEEILNSVDIFLNSSSKEYGKIILCTNGSFFDETNIPSKLQRKLLRKVNDTSVKTIIIETHIDTLSKEKLAEVRKELPDKNIIIEVGLESINPFVQENCYLKIVSTDKIIQMINYADYLNIRFQLNIIFGAPFLSNFDRIIDAKNSIQWALDNNALVTLFPMNIKPYTLLHYAYKNDFYKPISHWEVILLLNNYDANDLEEIDLAWYGNRDINFINGDNTIFPLDCEFCHNELQTFYSEYCSSANGIKRKKLVNLMLTKGENLCNCLNNARFNLKPIKYSIDKQVHYFHNMMSNSLLIKMID